ncbi:hypothetical protein PF005_g16101 [Phytophthora fragariae]|uniref:Uncharacterized protein n=1 Tax=Phytophthora fragariae TaxID=53985 RepID=A0A6A3R316_9STRA|nr:hypothetical protein PF003_g14621 [Phytophthora fragariae]KAE8920516.1 hypothetical protein PF009_g29189 [Phytophthora fragariae]KAE8965926.1 hypothetical protein PF011_g28116 [Phytophthora fragariae]KAE9064797.1 hypothetical protein PF010_g28473 [Phytophthora fragariae]KAE9074465.1 hypothetical protein PF006_g28539 [Phytophthora fragariae]
MQALGAVTGATATTLLFSVNGAENSPNTFVGAFSSPFHGSSMATPETRDVQCEYCCATPEANAT